MAGKVRHFQEHEGRYYTRIGIPTQLRPFFDGKRELRHCHGESLKKARRDHPGVEERFLAMLDRAREARTPADQTADKPRERPLTLGQFARWSYSFKLAIDREARDANPAYASMGIDDHYRDQLKLIVSGIAKNDLIEDALGGIIAHFARRSAKTIEPGSTEWRATARELAGVELEVMRRLYEREEGEPDRDPTHPLLVEVETPPVAISKGPGVSILGLLDGYLRELAKSGGGGEAKRRWTPGFKNFVRFLDHDDARLISKQDVIDWKDELLEELSPKTVKDTNIAALRAVLSWAIDNGKLPAGSSNPAAGIKIRVTKKTLDRPKGFTLEEALLILKAARDYQPAHSDNPATRESACVTAAKRWTPWLCAFSGARISEMTQLRTQDIMTEEGVTFMRITPDAGSTKNRQFRDVPLHPQIVEMGFLDFVKRAEPGPLFYNGKTARRGTRHASKYAAQRMATWIREVAPSLPMEVQPNHGWRHRMKSVSFTLEVNARVIDAMHGHAPRTAGETYGDVDLKARAAAIAKFPRYVITTPAEEPSTTSTATP